MKEDLLMLVTEFMPGGDLFKSNSLDEFRWYHRCGQGREGSPAKGALSKELWISCCMPPSAADQQFLGRACGSSASHKHCSTSCSRGNMWGCSFLLLCRGRQVALDIVSGLHIMHTAGICHLDLKSSNILVSCIG